MENSKAERLTQMRTRLYEVEMRLVDIEANACRYFDAMMYYALLQERDNLQRRIKELEKEI